MPRDSGLNFRFIFTIAVLLFGLLLAASFIWIGYEEARHHAIGNYAPIGDPTNFKSRPGLP
jgi:hypothetical protein